MILPDIPRLYTALAEILGAVLYAQAAPSRTAKPVYWGITAGCGALLAAFLYLTGDVPLLWWIPCMAAAIVWIYLYLLATRELNLLEAGYCCARAFIVAEFAASVEWQFHCGIWPQRGAWEPLSLLLLAVVYAVVYGFLFCFESRRKIAARLVITPHRHADGGGNGSDGLCRKQSELRLGGRGHNRGVLHPHAGGLCGRADSERPA